MLVSPLAVSCAVDIGILLLCSLLSALYVCIPLCHRKDEKRRQQMSVWFGDPIVVALCGAGAFFIYLLKVNYGDYMPYITVNHVLMNVFSIYGVFLFIFVCYLSVTY